MPKHTEWMHTKGGRVGAKGEHTHAARKLLGELKNQLALGGIKSGTMRAMLDDGTLIEVSMNMNIPAVRITPTGGGSTRSRVYETYAYIVESENVHVVKLGKYVSDDYDGAPLIETQHEMVYEKTIHIGIDEDCIAIALDSSRDRAFVSTYNGAGSDRIVMINTADNTVVRDFRPGGPYLSFRPFLLSVDESKGHVYNHAAYADNDRANISRLDPDTGAIVDMPYPEFTHTVPDIFFNKKNKKLYSLLDGSPSKLSSLDVKTLARVDFSSFTGGAYRIAVSPDGKFLFFTGYDSTISPITLRDFIGVVDLKTNTLIKRIYGKAINNHGRAFAHLSVSYDNKTLAAISSTTEDMLFLFDIEKIESIRNIFELVDFTQDGLNVIYGVRSATNTVGAFNEVKFSPDNKRCYVPSWEQSPTGYWFYCCNVDSHAIDSRVELPIRLTNIRPYGVSLLVRRLPDRIIE